MPGIKPWTAGCEAQTLPLCYAVPGVPYLRGPLFQRTSALSNHNRLSYATISTIRKNPDVAAALNVIRGQVKQSLRLQNIGRVHAS